MEQQDTWEKHKMWVLLLIVFVSLLINLIRYSTLLSFNEEHNGRVTSAKLEKSLVLHILALIEFGK